MPERFVSLATLLRPAPVPDPLSVRDDALPEPSPAVAVAPAPGPEEPERRDEAGVPALREALTFRLRLREAFERARDDLLADLAAGVLARELRLAPADVAAIGARLLRAHAADVPVALRVCAADAERAAELGADVPVEVDAALKPGDAVLVVRDGALESTLGIRLAAALAAR